MLPAGPGPGHPRGLVQQMSAERRRRPGLRLARPSVAIDQAVLEKVRDPCDGDEGSRLAPVMPIVAFVPITAGNGSDVTGAAEPDVRPACAGDGSDVLRGIPFRVLLGAAYTAHSECASGNRPDWADPAARGRAGPGVNARKKPGSPEGSGVASEVEPQKQWGRNGIWQAE